MGIVCGRSRPDWSSVFVCRDDRGRLAYVLQFMILMRRETGPRGVGTREVRTGIRCDGFTKPILYGIALRFGLGLCAIKMTGMCGEDSELVDVVQRVPEEIRARQMSQ